MKEDLAERIKSARKEAGFTQQQLADSLQGSLQTVKDWEAGRRAPTIDRLREIALALGKPAGWFFSQEGAPVALRASEPNWSTERELLSMLTREQEHSELMQHNMSQMNQNMSKMVETAALMAETMERTRADHARLTDALTQALATQQAFAAKQSERLTSRIEELEQQVDYLQRQLGGATPPQKRRQQLS